MYGLSGCIFYYIFKAIAKTTDKEEIMKSYIKKLIKRMCERIRYELIKLGMSAESYRDS